MSSWVSPWAGRWSSVDPPLQACSSVNELQFIRILGFAADG